MCILLDFFIKRIIVNCYCDCSVYEIEIIIGKYICICKMLFLLIYILMILN